jgi:hypothetical protein
MVSTVSGIQLPGPDELRPGPLRALTEALHELYRAAGTPGLRTIAATVTGDSSRFRDTVSHQKVSAMLHGTGVPKWSKLESVVLLLAEWSTPDRDPSEEAKRFKLLWDAASAGEAVEDPPAPVRANRLKSAFVLGGVTGEAEDPGLERRALETFCHRLGATIAKAEVDLVICSPFADAADFLVLRGYVEAEGAGTVHMHRPRYTDVDRRYAQLRVELGRSAVERIRSWYYPGPEKDSPDALGQAWVLCQLMAMEHADVIIAVGGKPARTASTILHLAEARHKPIVPFAFLGGAAERAFLRRDWEDIYPWLDASQLMDKNAVGSAMTIAEQMVMARVRQSDRRQGPPSAVFVSRARPDAWFARALDDYLSTTGLTVLFGERELPPDQTVEAAIEDAVRKSDLFIVLWSKSYAASRYCYDEIQLALRRHRAGEMRLWMINLDGSDVVPAEARDLVTLMARTPEDVVAVVRDLLAGAT